MRCTAIAVGFYVLAVAANIAVLGLEPPEESWPSSTPLLPLLALIVSIVPFQAAAEEYFFRGTLVQAIGAWSRSPWPAIVVSSAAFAIVHLAPLEVTIFLFAMAVVDAWLTIETGGLEAAIAGHTVNNIAAFVLLAAMGERIDIITDEFSWVALSLYALFYVAYAWAVVRQSRRHL